jgi:thiamine pyrophosphate-dependent acetolactate synthase large subunit-like protein
MTGAEMVLAALGDQGVEHIFGYPGGAVLPIYRAAGPLWRRQWRRMMRRC